MTAGQISVLMLEDRVEDAELVASQLARDGIDFVATRVQSEPEYVAALREPWDLLLADYVIPQFGALRALELLQRRGLDIPVIVVTGMVGEEAAVECLRRGASDYLLKDRLARLGAAVRRALADRALRDQRQRAEAVLRETDARLRLALQAANIGTWDVSLQERDVYYSPEWKRQIGYEDGELPNDSAEFWSRLHPDDAPRVAATRAAFLRDQSQGYDLEFRLRHKDGSYRWIRAQATLLVDAQNRPIRLVGCHVDLTDQKRTAAEREQLTKTMKLVLDSTGDGIFGMDLEGNCTFINPAGARAFGRAPEEVLGHQMHPLIHHTRPDGRPFPASECPTLRMLAGREGGIVQGEVFWRKDGTSFPVEYSSYPIVENGSVSGGVVTFADMSEKLKLEARIRQSQKLEAIGQLTGGVAHDFNNLLTVVLGYSDLMLASLPPDHPCREGAEEIRKAGESGAALTRQLLLFSRKHVLQPAVISLNDMVTSVNKLLRRVIGEDITLSLELSPDTPVVYADRTQVEQVLMNLAVNARDAMPSGGTLVIRTTGTHAVLGEPGGAPQPCAVLTVIDTGCGMSDEVKARMFEPFFTTKDPGRGTGLGLATVSTIVQQTGGRIEVESEVGRGTSFTIVLPATDRSGPGDRPDERKVAAAAGHERILLVEDEPAVRRLVQSALEHAGYDVRVASSAEEALAEADGHLDLLVTDVILPGMDGCELARTIAATRAGVKVLYMSGYTGTAMLNRQGLEAGESLLSKPFTPGTLARKVRDILRAS